MLILAPRAVDQRLQIGDAIATVPATARWERAARDGRGAIGVQFDELPSDVRANIAQYVALMGIWLS